MVPQYQKQDCVENTVRGNEVTPRFDHDFMQSKVAMLWDSWGLYYSEKHSNRGDTLHIQDPPVVLD